MKTRLLFLLLVFVSLGNAQVTNGLIQHFKFDNSYSNVAGTSSFSAASFTTDRSGYANSAIRMTNALQSQATIPGLPYGNTARTISFWARALAYSGLNYDPVFSYGTGTTGNACGGAFSQDRTMFVSQNDDFTLIMGGNPNTVGTWYHFVMTYDGTTAKIYRNGQLIGSLAKSWNTLNNNDIFRLGVGTAGQQWFNGVIDDLKIFNRAVSDVEAEQIYNEPNTNTIGLIKSFSFNNSPQDDGGTVSFATNNASFPITYAPGRNGAAGQGIVTTASATRTCTIPNLPLGVTDRTISLWYYHTTFSPITSYASFAYGGNAQYNTFGFYLNATQVNFQGFSYDQPFTNGTTNPYQWYHAVVVLDQAVVKIYINGTLRGTVPRPLLNTTLTSFRIGAFAGVVDDLKIYDRALSQTDITSLYTTNNIATPAPSAPSPQSFCGGSLTFGDLVATGTNLKWYDSPTGGFLYSNSNNFFNGTFYVSQTVNGIESTRTPVQVIINPLPAAPTAQQQTFCSGSGATFADIVTTGTNIKWYTQGQLNGTLIPSTNVIPATGQYWFSQTVNGCEGPRASVLINVWNTTTPIFSGVAPICSGQTLAALPTTSLNGYTGTWSPALNNTATTTYTFTPTTGQCATTQTLTITVNSNVTPTFAAVNPICSGATLSALPTTSTNGISGTWSPALNNTATTTYTFTPTAGQCATTQTLTITVNSNVTPTFAAVSPICSGATLSALPTTSTNGITGTWSPTLNNTATTTYTFTPTAGQCATTQTLTITVNSNVTPTFAAVSPICAGATLSALPTTSTNGITGTWSPALNNTATTTYTFTPTTGQCATTQTLTITVNSNVTPTFAAVNPICSGATLSALPTTSTNGISGTWSPALNNTATTTYTFTPTAGQCATTQTLTITVNSNVTPTFAAVNPICSGATLSALTTTSTNGITGTWSPALNNTATTTYTFTPTAGQCATTQTLTITVNSNVTPTFAAVNPICSGATLSALPTTSTNGITGTWSPALNNTATTTYTFTPIAGQCATNQTLTITVNSNVTPTFAAVNPICSGATLSALPTTSTNGITGTWSPVLNNTATTTYTFTPNAGQCATTQTLTITVNSNVTPTFAAVSPICSGATLSALPTTSTNGITGTWSPALNNTATTTYTFTPTAGQCATTQTLTITVNSAATPTGSASQTFVEGETIANIVVNPTTVVWYASESDAISNTNPLATETLLVNNATYYAVNVVSTCRSTAFEVTVTVTLGVNDFNSISFALYPNPADEILNIETTLELKSVEMYTLHGQKVLTSNQNQIDVAHLAAGVYMVRIQDVENNTATKKVILK